VHFPDTFFNLFNDNNHVQFSVFIWSWTSVRNKHLGHWTHTVAFLSPCVYDSFAFNQNVKNNRATSNLKCETRQFARRAQQMTKSMTWIKPHPLSGSKWWKENNKWNDFFSLLLGVPLSIEQQGHVSAWCALKNVLIQGIKDSGRTSTMSTQSGMQQFLSLTKCVSPTMATITCLALQSWSDSVVSCFQCCNCDLVFLQTDSNSASWLLCHCMMDNKGSGATQIG